MSETWRPCLLVPGAHHIWVSDIGNVKSEPRIAAFIQNGIVRTQKRPGRQLSPWISKNGYFCVAVKVGDKRTKYLVHRLVALTFIPTKDIFLSVNHIDCNKLNNRAENLEWCTLAENTRMQWRDGLVNLRGERQPGSKLTSQMIMEIRKRPDTVANMAIRYGVSTSQIYNVIQRKQWNHI